MKVKIKKPTGGQVAIAILLLVLGILMSMQIKSVRQSNELKNLEKARAIELAEQINKLREENVGLRQQIYDYEKKIKEYQDSAASISKTTELLKEELDKVKILAGLTDVEGPGIIITLDDSKMPTQPNVDPNSFLLHDSDILQVINELRAAGAEAIAINDQRLVSTTEIRCAGPTISINNTRYSAPYIIKAIGDPKILKNSLEMRGGIIDLLKEFSIEVKIEEASKVVIPRYTGSLRFNYAKIRSEGS
ncbi:protein of unknown function DUF881 [Caldicellulosiruptor kronotskyensis 2002]|uniref:Division initiation protein n=1 Tax=Caldicellulosiruptor kronotskyensis (strain DSM 18902 / VKM B-2412 / 2002) TaxID=632348 RepID=E4SG41_CALK2|nr:DUF881 domain-containing protein [Caldicellulosiruptor kronotskyensis]ADQ46716.1 protein of unknown function DUF881 [Caldicellulosiruptor kronotskyensis 2002]